MFPFGSSSTPGTVAWNSSSNPWNICLSQLFKLKLSAGFKTRLILHSQSTVSIKKKRWNTLVCFGQSPQMRLLPRNNALLQSAEIYGASGKCCFPAKAVRFLYSWDSFTEKPYHHQKPLAELNRLVVCSKGNVGDSGRSCMYRC